MNNRILIIGGKGMLGQALQHVFLQKETTAIALAKEECDVTKPHEIQKQIEETKADQIINCAAYTKVDNAEKDGRREQNGLGAPAGGSRKC